MKAFSTPVFVVASGAMLLGGGSCLTAEAQSVIESGTSILAPAQAPTGGYASNPQEYLSVAWTVTENNSGIYTYSYAVQNPSGDVLLNSSGGLTSTLEIYDAFSADFNTTVPGAYLSTTQTGGFFQQVNAVDLAWFFNPSVSAGSAPPTVTFQSDLPPTLGNASAEGAIPWSSVSPSGQEVPVPDVAVPEPTTMALLIVTALLFLRCRASLLERAPVPAPVRARYRR